MLIVQQVLNLYRVCTLDGQSYLLRASHLLLLLPSQPDQQLRGIHCGSRSLHTVQKLTTQTERPPPHIARHIVPGPQPLDMLPNLIQDPHAIRIRLMAHPRALELWHAYKIPRLPDRLLNRVIDQHRIADAPAPASCPPWMGRLNLVALPNLVQILHHVHLIVVLLRCKSKSIASPCTNELRTPVGLCKDEIEHLVHVHRL